MESYNMKLSFLLLLMISTVPLALSLRVNFYRRSCHNAESIIQRVVQQRFRNDRSVTAALLRMHFHDCFVRGCDASILIDSTASNQAEKAAGPNLTVREFDLIDQIKSRLEAACPRTVSCADILTLATRDAVALAGGPKYNVPTGRRDGLISQASDVRLPGPSFTISEAQQSFADKGLTLDDMVVLLGGHTVGVTHCNFFQDRLSNFQGSGGPDPTMDLALVNTLLVRCGSDPNVNPTAFLDRNTSFTVDNEYYNQIQMNRGVLQIDQELALDPLSSILVTRLGANNRFFGRRFANAMLKMANIEVLEGRAGQIRRNCRRKN